jgi:carbonic anhydrase/acetyltransferase-like protein (isoleucine patch superfamily)
MAIYRLGEDSPQLAPGCWVADNATVLGRVRLGEASSVWYGAVLRGDNDLVSLGARCNVQDGAVLHADEGIPLHVEDGVSIGHLAMLHGCRVGAGSLIGIHSVVLNGARIGRHCLVGANALVPEGKEFPDGALILGSPARVVRMLTPERIASIGAIADHYVKQVQRHRRVQRVDV